MKRSEIYHLALMNIVDSLKLSAAVKLEMIEFFMAEKRFCESVEKTEAEKKEVANNG